MITFGVAVTLADESGCDVVGCSRAIEEEFQIKLDVATLNAELFLSLSPHSVSTLLKLYPSWRYRLI